jgi:hypothetical protein
MSNVNVANQRSGEVEYRDYVTLQTQCCGVCGGVYAITERHDKYCREHGKSWTCPYCKCTWGYDHDRSPLEQAKRDAERYREERDRSRVHAQRMRDERDTVERQRRAQKAAKTRVMNRIKAGECPCCGKTFPDLHKHMTEQHPHYGKQKQVE